MSIVNSIETVRDWLTAEVCPLVKLKLPDDKATDASYPYKLVNPAAFSLFVPSKDRTPPNIAAPIPSVCVHPFGTRSSSCQRPDREPPGSPSSNRAVLQQKGAGNTDRFSRRTSTPSR